jgi:hypothetical protein
MHLAKIKDGLKKALTFGALIVVVIAMILLTGVARLILIAMKYIGAILEAYTEQLKDESSKG